MMPIKELDIVVSICEREDRFLLIQRRDNNPLFDKKWEFPGGKFKIGEDPNTAINREIVEEIGIMALQSRFFGIHTHDWHLDDHILRVHIHCFHSLVGEGLTKLEETKAYQHKWVTKRELLKMDILEANKNIVNTFFHEALSNMD
jgi:8-oxo-dGTP diphosphatase